MENGPAFFNPTTDAAEYRRCLGQFATGITVATTKYMDEMIGLTANSFSSLSLAPPLILWSVGKESSRFKYFHEAEFFNVNVLSADQIDISRLFSRQRQGAFAEITWFSGSNDVPVINGCSAVFECKTEMRYDGGDHIILVGRVLRAANFAKEGLLFAAGRYGVVADHPQDTINSRTSGSVAATQHPLLLSSMFRAAHCVADVFNEQREGLSREDHRVLISLEAKSGITFEALLRDTFLGRRAVKDAVASLVACGLVEELPNGLLILTTDGRNCRVKLQARLTELEHKMLAGHSADTIAAVHNVLDGFTQFTETT